MSDPPSQPSVASTNHFRRSTRDVVEVPSAMEEDVEFKSVYVRNVPTTMAESEIEAEFKKYGKISPAGVVIRLRKGEGYLKVKVLAEESTKIETPTDQEEMVIISKQFTMKGHILVTSNVQERLGFTIEQTTWVFQRDVLPHIGNARRV